MGWPEAVVEVSRYVCITTFLIFLGRGVFALAVYLKSQ